ncbi:MAG: DNA mismatch repair endonuclease MutL [Phycisphaerae bacterium]|nr:DNA mismatch repair endonuclease MutL [Phycisphaerae bacterium]MDD5380906.1 DNA mismatch repair endonuclease MutL [Phycisphaerae bacterium]
MAQIVVLDQNMINMIAAGEVIERPASVVKELMENSIDAGATKITVSIEDGGRKLISVTDNGCGMDAKDLATAFESHTTSKIKTSKDLQSISTLGFRGEALASIASVAQVRAISRTKGSASGNCIEIDCGNKGSISPANADYGTTIQVRDLFYKLPARRKFLKTANTEMGHITEYFTRIALANGNLDMVLNHNGKELYRLSGKQDLRQRIAELLSSEFGENLIEAESSEKDLHISALLGKPGISRTNNKFQYVFLNGRFIRDKFISHAIKEAYRGCIEQDRFPVVFLFIRMPCENYDVNVHPTKIEVRFYNANLIHSQVLGALREKLLGTNLQTQAKLPSVESPRREGPSPSGYRSREIADAMAEFFKKHRAVQTQQQFDLPAKNRFEPLHPPARQITESQKGLLQIHDSYIVAEADDGFIIVDQHALHERIIYEDLCGRIQKSSLESQKLLIPESFQLTDAQADALDANAELLEKLGIEIAPFGPRTFAIQAFPTLLAKASPLDFVQDLIDLLSDKGVGLDAEKLLDEILNMVACKAAVKAGTKLTGSEMEQLLADKEKTERLSRCPHGRPTIIKFTLAELEKQFKRT